MKKLLLSLLSLGLVVSANAAGGDAFVEGGVRITPSQYTVHLLAFELRTTNGAFKPFVTGDNNFDIAEAAAGGGTVGNYGSGISTPVGVFNGMRFTMRPYMTVVTAVGIDNLGQRCHTATGAATRVVDGITLSTGVVGPGAATPEQISIPVDSPEVQQELSQGDDFDVLPGGILRGTKIFDGGAIVDISPADTESKIKLLFGVTNAVEIFANAPGQCVIIPNEPQMSAEEVTG